MKTFCDSQGRAWPIRITIDAVRRVRELLPGVDLLKLMEPAPVPAAAAKLMEPAPVANDKPADDEKPTLLTKLSTDLELLINVVYCLAKPQLEEQGVSDLDFGAALEGPAIHELRAAFWGELSDFYQSLQDLAILQAIKTQLEAVASMMRATKAKLTSIDVDASVHKILGKQFGDLPDSLVFSQVP